MSNNTDDDDITAFVQDIDARKPLRRALSDRRSHPLGEDPEREVDHRAQPHRVIRDGSPAARIDSEPSNTSIKGIGEPMLTNASDIDQKLKDMNDAFSTRLAGLSGTAPSPRTSGGGFEDRDRSAPRERVPTMRRPFLPERFDPMSRNRRSSMGSVKSGLSIGSEEVIGKLELEDKRRSKGV